MPTWSTRELVEFLAAISSCTDEQSATRAAVERAAQALDAEAAALILGDRCVATTGFPHGQVPTGELVAVPRATAIDVPGAGTCELLTVALEAGAGWLIVARDPSEPYDHEDASLLRGMARVLVLALRQIRLIDSERALREQSQREVGERRAIARELAHQVLHDGLTGLPNRTLLLDRLEHALSVARRQGTAVAVLFVDIDNFKLINDTLGHQSGDEMLRLVSARLRRSVCSDPADAGVAVETVARFGGDEFVLLAEGLRDDADAARIAERIEAHIALPFDISGERLFVTASIGIAMSDTGSTPESLIRDADAAMYHAKASGRARFELFDDAMRAGLLHRLSREKELRRALDRGELLLFYQPIVAVADGSVIGAEALIRWRHPDKGLIAAGDFIPLAEESGLIVQIDDWVAGEACAQLAAWQGAGGALARIILSMNVSARQLRDTRFLERLATVLAQSGVDPRGLGLEITESVLIEKGGSPIAILEALRRLGPRLILDDFGTGYSSLSYLQRLPLDVLKLDRSFMAGVGERGRGHDIFAVLLHLARVLELSVVAEGVETDQQFESLRSLGCAYAQGFGLGRPMPVHEFGALVDAAAAARGAVFAPWRDGVRVGAGALPLDLVHP